MITLNRTAADAASSTALLTRPAALSNSQNPGDSFAQQLVAALEGYLSQNANASHMDISIDAEPGQDSTTRQFLITVKDSSSTSTTTAPPSSSIPASPLTVSSNVSPPSSGVAVSSVAPTDSSRATADSAPITDETDAYWATQPKEVQVLRTIQDFKERQAKAQDLMNQGFSIDPEIMVYHDDPYITMRERQDLGYTWVPAAGQPNIPVAPGLSFPGLPSYTPAQPPAGSIKVSTDFVKGYEDSIPCGGIAWIKNT